MSTPEPPPPPPPPAAPAKKSDSPAKQVETVKQEAPQQRRTAMTPGATILTLGGSQDEKIGRMGGGFASFLSSLFGGR